MNYGSAPSIFSSFDLATWLYFLTIILFFVSLIISASVKHKFKKYAVVKTKRGIRGIDAAQRMMADNGIRNVSIQQISGVLTDNYNPIKKTLNLSEAVCYSDSVSAVAVAAHECGHAIQDAKRYPLLILRKTIVPATNIGSYGSYVAIILGLIFSKPELIELGAVLFSVLVVFNLITLPVEINASKRAMAEIQKLELLTDEEQVGAKKVLTAAAMTYFIALVSSIAQLARLLALANRRR